MPKADHFALLVTINRYPGLQDLLGPENDGEALKKWLLAPQGGDIAANQLIHIRSSDFAPADNPDDAKPTERELVRALNGWLRTNDGWKDKVGERLYLFFAGHGFTAGSTISDPALFSAVAQNGDTAHIAGYRYAAKIANAGFFDEIVLVMDCCQDVLKASQVLEPTWSPPDRNQSARVKMLQAYGAPRGRKAFERELSPGGGQHGLFSSVWVEALSSALPDAEGWVTGQAVKNQVLQIWGKRFRSEINYDPPVRLPDAEDIRLYCRDMPAVAVPVDLSAVIQFAAPQLLAKRGITARVRRERSDGPLPPPPSAPPAYIDVSAATAHLDLANAVNGAVHGDFHPDAVVSMPPGLYTLETPSGQPDLAFEVLPSVGQASPVDGLPVEESAVAAGNVPGDLVSRVLPTVLAGLAPTAPVDVTVSSPDEELEITVVDANFNKVASGSGKMTVRLASGLYKAQVRLSGAVSETMFRVGDQPVSVELPPLVFQSAAPLLATANTHLYRTYRAVLASALPAKLILGKPEGELFVFVRDSARRPGRSAVGDSCPWQQLGVESLDEDLSAPLFGCGSIFRSAGYGYFKAKLPAGNHVLISPLVQGGDGEEIGMLVPVIPGWRTEVFLDCVEDPAGSEGEEAEGATARELDWGAASMFLVELGQRSPLLEVAGRATEIARLRLGCGRPVASHVLVHAARSPLVALFAAYSALAADPQDKAAIRRCLEALPALVRRYWPDAVLLDRWCEASYAAGNHPSLIPALNAGWKSPDGRGPKLIHDDLAVEAIGQWLAAGSFWTQWRQPAAIALKFRQVLRARTDRPYGEIAPISASPAIEPAWEIANWAAVAQGLGQINLEFSPFQQALRRRILDGLADGLLPSGEVERLAATFGISPALMVRAYAEVFAWAKDGYRILN